MPAVSCLLIKPASRSKNVFFLPWCVPRPLPCRLALPATSTTARRPGGAPLLSSPRPTSPIPSSPTSSSFSCGALLPSFHPCICQMRQYLYPHRLASFAMRPYVGSSPLLLPWRFIIVFHTVRHSCSIHLKAAPGSYKGLSARGHAGQRATELTLTPTPHPSWSRTKGHKGTGCPACGSLQLEVASATPASTWLPEPACVDMQRF